MLRNNHIQLINPRVIISPGLLLIHLPQIAGFISRFYDYN